MEKDKLTVCETLIDYDEWQKKNCPPHKMYTSRQKVEMYLESINQSSSETETLESNEAKEKFCECQVPLFWSVFDSTCKRCGLNFK